MERNILHLDLDSFFVSVERLKNSKLKGVPVIVGGMSDRGVVAGCSYEARHFGVHSAMPMRMARQLCPSAVCVRGDMEHYSLYSKMVTDIIEDLSPLFEKASIDEHYIDITGMDRFFGCFKWSKELRTRIIKETGLPVSFGLSVNKTVSKIATGEAKPNGERLVERVMVQPFLNPLSIRKIPMVGPQTYQLLSTMGISTIGTLVQIPREMMVQVLGKNGVDLWNKANGIDPTPIQNWREQKSMSAERTFDKDSTNVQTLEKVLIRMAENLSFDLRSQQRMTSCVTVKIRYSNFDTHNMQKKIPYTAFDHVLKDVVKGLFNQLYQRRMPIRLVGVRFSKLINGTYQMNMFEDSSEMICLYQSIDRIKKRFGKNVLHTAITMYDKDDLFDAGLPETMKGQIRPDSRVISGWIGKRKYSV